MPSSSTPKILSLKLAAMVCGWLLVLGWGTWKLSAYSLTPGAQGVAPLAWPDNSLIKRDSTAFTLVVALHPECPCSEATIDGLASILAQSGGRMRTHALFVQLPGLPPVEESDLWQQARRIPGLKLARDTSGTESRRFGARTSGETLLYGPEGQLRFRGGITISRGHVGDSPGQTAIVNLVRQSSPSSSTVTTPVFGCALWNDRVAAAP